MPFPIDAVTKLVNIIKAGIASGDLIGTLVAHWAEVAQAVIQLLQWVFEQAQPDVVKSVMSHEDTSVAGQLVALYQEESGVTASTVDGVIPPELWVKIITWIISLLLTKKQ